MILILLLALTVKFIFFEDKEELTEQILMSSTSAAMPDRQNERKHKNCFTAISKQRRANFKVKSGLACFKLTSKVNKSTYQHVK